MLSLTKRRQHKIISSPLAGEDLRWGVIDSPHPDLPPLGGRDIRPSINPVPRCSIGKHSSMKNNKKDGKR
jgi:hypothetical protein